jgi:hypothetical protein
LAQPAPITAAPDRSGRRHPADPADPAGPADVPAVSGGSPAVEADGLLETVKKAAVELKRAEIPFALGGGWAAYARGGPRSEHDADFVLCEQDVPRALDVLEKAGFTAGDPPEDWLAKVYDADRMVDLIYRQAGQPVDRAMFDRCDHLEVGSVLMPVVAATDLVVAKLMSFQHHHCDFAKALPMVRALREQVDWPAVRSRTVQSPFAEAFLLLADRLGLTTPGGPAEPGPDAAGGTAR